MSRLCGICGEPHRKGSNVWAMRAGRLVSLRACRDCTRGALVLVLPEALCCIECGRHAPVLCLGCAKDARERAEAAERKAKIKARARAQKKTLLSSAIWPKGNGVEP